MSVVGGVYRATLTKDAPAGTFREPSRSGRAKIQTMGKDGLWEPAEEVEVRNDFHRPVPAGSRVKLTRIDGEYYIISAACE